MTPDRPNLDKTLLKYISAHFFVVYMIFLDIKIRYFVNLSMTVKITLYLIINIDRETIKSIIYIVNSLLRVSIAWRFS